MLETKMLKITTLILALFLFSSSFAETYYVTGIVQSIEPVYSSTNVYTPETRCRNIKVPVYGKVVSGNGASGADVLGGMVVGALLGKALTNDNNAAGVGAVMGGVVAAEKQKKTTTKVVGYNTEQRCEVVQTVSQQSDIKDYRVIYSWNGFTGSSLTGRYYEIGSKIQIKVGLSLD
jgi:uncharacterized protein YcfJ